MMNVKTKRRLSAWMLLSVFVPMLLLASLHVHQESDMATVSCTDCANHIAHSGHLSLQTIHGTSCVLCQFVSLPFIAATVTLLAVACAYTATQCVTRFVPCQAGVNLLYQPRAPPVI